MATGQTPQSIAMVPSVIGLCFTIRIDAHP